MLAIPKEGEPSHIQNFFFLDFRLFAEKKYSDKTGEVQDVKLIVISLSPQPILSLAVRYNLSPNEAAQKLAGKGQLQKHNGINL